MELFVPEPLQIKKSFLLAWLITVHAFGHKPATAASCTGNAFNGDGPIIGNP